MIVDDNASVCSLIVETLTPLGYDCLQTTSAKDAIDMIQKHEGKVHLLIADVVMPDLNGRELARILKEKKPEMKVIFISGYTESVITRYGMLETGINYIPKPLTPVVLAEKIRNVLCDG